MAEKVAFGSALLEYFCPLSWTGEDFNSAKQGPESVAGG
jgi:hypothetical protein